MSLFQAKPIEISIPEGCPWHSAQVTYGTPNVDWCEPTICAVINEPANTWSNLPFLFVGIYLFQQKKYPVVRNFGLVVFLMGLMSGVYHATNNLLTQYFDFLGMALMMSFLLSVVTQRIQKVEVKAFDLTFWMYLSINLTILLFFGVLKIPPQTLMLFGGAGILLAEIWYWKKFGKARSFHFFALSIFTLIIAQIFAQLDLKRIWCEPNNAVLHGHVFWHILCAVGMYFAGSFLKANTKSL